MHDVLGARQPRTRQHRFDLRVAGWAGIVAGIGLRLEGVLWTVSGWTPETFADPAAAMAFLRDGGITLRWAVLSGFVNLGFLVVLVAGLAAWLHRETPSLATTTLWFGMIGITLHLLVPVAHWYGVPAFLDAAARDPRAAEAAWIAFIAVGHEAAGGAGTLFMGLAMITAGSAILGRGAMPASLGWLGLLAVATAVLTLFAPATPLSAVAGALFVPSLVLAIVFRIWAGIALTRIARPG